MTGLNLKNIVSIDDIGFDYNGVVIVAAVDSRVAMNIQEDNWVDDTDDAVVVVAVAVSWH